MLNVRKNFMPACIAAGIILGNVSGVTYTFVHLNFFTQDVVDSGQSAVFKYYPFKPADEKAVIAGVRLNYIANNDALVALPMTKTGDHYTATVNAPPSASIDFYYTLECRPLLGAGRFSDDTKWFTKIMGKAFEPAPYYRLTVETSGRLRGRHENEYRSDIFPGANYKNTVYSMSFKDYGDSIEFAIFPFINSSALELHAFNHIPVDSICKRAEFALNMGSATNFLVKQHTGPTQKFPQGSPFGAALPWYTATAAALSNGELIDFELLVTDAASAGVLTSAINRYYVGSGKMGQEYQHPWANAAGAASISSITEPQFSFTQHCSNALPASAMDFLAGKTVFDTDWKSGFLRNNRPTPDCNGTLVTDPVEKSPFDAPGSLGPSYLQPSCYDCHVLAGAGHAADSAGDSLQAIVFLGEKLQNSIVPHPAYGDMLRCKNASGSPADGGIQVSYTRSSGAFGDGAPYSLRAPAVDFVNLSKGPMGADAVFSYRISPLLCGTGLLDAIPDDTIVSRADSSDRDGDGISGRVNLVTDPVDGKPRPGRFGCKASMPSLKGEIAYLANRCLGLTTNLFLSDGSGGAGAELSDTNLALLFSYVALTVPPPRKNWQDPSAIRGKAHFEKAGCVKCHVPAVHTGNTHQFPELRNLEIQPFTDLLLHDMGPGLADNWGALGSEWRTPPLWGIGNIADAGGRESYLHDGRAGSIIEAILWHGGEAEKAKSAVLGLSAAQRNDLVAYCKYPFADRLARPLSNPVVPWQSKSSFSARPGFSCFPNPIHSHAEFFLTGIGNTSLAPLTLRIYNLRGQCVFNSTLPNGSRKITWDARRNESGAYFALLSAEGRTYKREVLVVK
jgi:CxxC motif-containing protein (DUF1111 family)